ncbi:unnamed protein product [Clavelina lepadiformis]|uniref:Uncharacterized protein n=1 Tax=Clavelina lepadiformis TaxID=159417 RepID=A0ABP0GRJ3_CLALP
MCIVQPVCSKITENHGKMHKNCIQIAANRTLLYLLLYQRILSALLNIITIAREGALAQLCRPEKRQFISISNIGTTLVLTYQITSEILQYLLIFYGTPNEMICSDESLLHSE